MYKQRFIILCKNKHSHNHQDHRAITFHSIFVFYCSDKFLQSIPVFAISNPINERIQCTLELNQRHYNIKVNETANTLDLCVEQLQEVECGSREPTKYVGYEDHHKYSCHLAFLLPHVPIECWCRLATVTPTPDRWHEPFPQRTHGTLTDLLRTFLGFVVTIWSVSNDSNFSWARTSLLVCIFVGTFCIANDRSVDFWCHVHRNSFVVLSQWFEKHNITHTEHRERHSNHQNVKQCSEYFVLLSPVSEAHAVRRTVSVLSSHRYKDW